MTTKKRQGRTARNRRYALSEDWREFTMPYVRRMPKTDLHVHLDGSLRLRHPLGSREGAGGLASAPGSQGALRNKGPGGGGVPAASATTSGASDITLRVMQEPEALTRIAYELAEDAAAENVRYLEVRYSPLLHLRGPWLPDTVDAVLAGLKAAEQRVPHPRPA